MRRWNLIGKDIGIQVDAETREEAIEIAENLLLQGLGGYVDCLDEDDEEQNDED